MKKSNTRRVSRTFRAANHYNVKLSGRRGKGWSLFLTLKTRRGRPLLRVSKDYLYVRVPPAEARRMLATMKEMLL